ncbi:retrovirus-related Pol polyprotein from transposon 412 [Trichonephila clavipes]|nr:retrovirus-related Pol polyprotein from transposon 412 [Trichonephila clavipes]
MGVVELNIQIRDFEKPWLFHVLADLEYPCILGIDFIGGSRIVLDFDRKSLAIQDSQASRRLVILCEICNVIRRNASIHSPKSLRNEIMREFHDKPLAGHFGRFKTYHKIRDVCYFPYKRKFIDQYVSTCHMCQINNYKNALPAGRLIPIVSNYPNEIVTLDLLGPYPVSRVRRKRYVLVITDHFSKWAEIIPLKKASARVIANNFFDNYISRFVAPIKLISDNGPQFIPYIFENLSERLGIRHVKTVVYRPQANRTERVNRDLVQMIANYINEQHDTWDQFLREFAYAIRTAVNETTGKTPAELFLGRKLITPFQKLVMVSDGTEFAVGDIERLFEEAR